MGEPDSKSLICIQLNNQPFYVAKRPETHCKGTSLLTFKMRQNTKNREINVKFIMITPVPNRITIKVK